MRVSGNLADILKNTMEEKGISLSELSRLSNIGKSSIHDYINGKTTPKQNNIFRLAKALNVSEAYLMGWESDNKIIETSETEDISTKLEKMMKQLADQKEALMFRGEPMDDETKEAVWLAMQQAMKFAEMSMRKEANKKEE